MNKKALGMFLIGASFLFYSCVDDTYDLANKEVHTDIEIKGNKLALPLGSLRPFMLDSLIRGLNFVETDAEGVYCIKMSDKLYMEKQIRPIVLSIPRQSITQELSLPSTIPFIAEGTELAISIPLEKEKEISIHNVIPRQFTRIHKCHFKNEMALEIKILLDDLAALQATSAELDLTFTLPSILAGLRSDDPNITIKANKFGTDVHIKKPYPISNKEGLVIKLYCPEFDFTKDLTDGIVPDNNAANEKNANLSYASKVKTKGDIKLQFKTSNTANDKQNQKLNFNIDFSSSSTTVQTISGGFNDEFYNVKSTFGLNLSEELVSFAEHGNVIKLANPRIEVVLSNAITIPVETIEMEAYGKDKEGNILEPTKINANFTINSADIDKNTGDVIVDTTKWILTTQSNDINTEGYEIIKTPNLENWLKSAPDSVTYTVHPIIDRTVITDIRVDHVMSIGAEYKAIIPFNFDSLHISYSDTIPANLELDEESETFNDMGVRLKMNVTNTLPLGLSLKITALDQNYTPLESIKLDSIKFVPCLEENATLQTTTNKEKIQLTFDNRNGDIAKLNHLKFDFEIDNGPISLKNTQGLQVSDIVIEVFGDIKTNMNE